MLEFDKSQIEALKEYLYYSYVHDANIETISYDRGKKFLKLGYLIQYTKVKSI